MQRIESRSLTLEANLGELQRLVKVQNSSGATPLIVTSGTTTAVTSFAGNNHSVGRLHACPDKGTTTTIGQRDQKNQTYIHLTNVADKGKGIIENDSRYMWNVIIPNSLGYDDDIVIDENLSTPPLVVGCRRMGLQSGTMMHWELGTPKLSLGGNISRPCIEQRSTDKAFNDFPGFEQLDRTSVVCEVFSHSATPLCANKILKPHHLIATVEATNPIQPESAGKSITRLSQGERGVRHPRLISRLESLIFLIPMSHEMVFDPTADTDLTYDECRIATYVYAKIDDLDKVLFKFYELEVARDMFHSLIPKFVPHSDIVNIVVVFASLRASRDTPICFCFLPSPFAVDVIQLRPIDVIVKKHLCRWMPITTKLEKVIIPICEPNHSWYIMVVHVKQGRVYSLDITKTDENMERRERNMRTINTGSFREVSSDPTTWGPINYPKGVPSLPDRRLGVMMSEKVRMKTATKIILPYWNQKKRAMDQEAEKLWRTLMRTHD
ncbi:uncharacterized protein DS421_20g686930 [Arachis hypogaea]|nr:uncharacterized protein DS421_20g686930 [Arachis hypogaea]